MASDKPKMPAARVGRLGKPLEKGEAMHIPPTIATDLFSAVIFLFISMCVQSERSRDSERIAPHPPANANIIDKPFCLLNGQSGNTAAIKLIPGF